MSATVDQRAGDFRTVPLKRCPCGRTGEWPGRLCPDCKAAQPAAAEPPPIAAPAPAGPTLEELAAIANSAHQRAHLAGRQLIDHAIEAGDALLKAQRLVKRGQWLAWVSQNVGMHLTTAYRYMRIAEHTDLVRAGNAESIEHAIQLLADQPRRGHGPRGYSDADKREWLQLADEIGVKPAARAVGVSPATMHAWTSPSSPSRGKSRESREITQDRIDRVAIWLVERFGSFDYPDRVTAEVRVDAARLLRVVFEIEASE